MLRVGLTGGIACGKSQVLARLAAAGLPTLDLDQVAHGVMASAGPAYGEVVSAFGPGIVAGDGTIDRKRLGELVFADGAARERLNAIVHPHVRAEEARWVARGSGESGAVLVTDAALLLEAGVHLRFDRLVVVHCSADEQLRRLTARDGLSERAALARIESQMPVAEKRRFAHFEVDTSGALADTVQAADRLAAELRSVSGGRGEGATVPLDRGLGALVHGPRTGPRGLTPSRLLREIVSSNGIELQGLVGLLDPPGQGPWYRVARSGETGPSPAALAVPVVLWSLARSAPDPPYLLGAVAALARLTHTDSVSIATACLFARVVLQVAVEGRVGPRLLDEVGPWSEDAAGWGGAPPVLRGVLEAALRFPEDPVGAGQAAGGGGGEPALAGALVGLAVGAGPQGVPQDLVADLRRLASHRAR